MLECWWVYSCTDLVQVATAAVSEFVWVVVLSYPGTVSLVLSDLWLFSLFLLPLP